MDDIHGATVNEDGPSSHGKEELDLVGGPFAVVESDPSVFTGLLCKLGIRGLEVVELYDIEPWATNGLKPHGLIFCFLWHKDSHRAKDFADLAAERVWFANQLNQDSCASVAVLNVLLNCPGCQVGEQLGAFRTDTAEMSSVMKGLAISNSPFIREAHNSLTRPADVRGALNAIACTTLDASEKLQGTKPPPQKRRKTIDPEVGDSEVYHFVGYVSAHRKVWELDGLKLGPLEVGELQDGTEGWMDVVRPALRRKMKKYGGTTEAAGDIRFNLLAIVDDGYMASSDRLELLKRERVALERKLDEVSPGWKDQIDATLATESQAFTTTPGPTFSQDFGHEVMQRQIAILHTPPDRLQSAWVSCVRKGLEAKAAIEEEISKEMTGHAENIARTHDFEPFIGEYIKRLHQEGLLNSLLGRDEKGQRLPAKSKGKGKGPGLS